MIIVTTDFVPGYDVQEVKGFVRGSTVQSKNVGRDILAGLKNLVGGEIKDYTSMMDSARQQAIGRLVQHAEEKERMLSLPSVWKRPPSPMPLRKLWPMEQPSLFPKGVRDDDRGCADAH